MRQQQQELTMRPQTTNASATPGRVGLIKSLRRTRKLPHRDRYFDGLDDG